MYALRLHRRGIATAALALLGAGLAAVTVWYFFFSGRGEEAGPPAPQFAAYVDQPTTGPSGVSTTSWVEPTAVAVAGDTFYVLDSGNDRIVAINEDGETAVVLCETGECAFLLSRPRDLVLHDGLLWVANTEAGVVNALTTSGEIRRSIELPTGPGDAEPRPSGIAFGADGTMYVADGANDRVVRFGPTGMPAGYVGEGREEDDRYTFSQPAGIDVDEQGNLYVADTGNGLVKKYSPEGRHLSAFAMVAGNPDISSPLDVVVSKDGLLFFSDLKRSIVHVFSPEARYLGILGLLDASRVDSPGVLNEPSGLDLVGDKLYVIDRQSGLYVFQFDAAYWSRASDG